jgi:hypothetical protein
MYVCVLELDVNLSWNFMCVCEVLELYVQLHILLLHVQLYVQLYVLLPNMFMFRQKTVSHTGSTT